MSRQLHSGQPEANAAPRARRLGAWRWTFLLVAAAMSLGCMIGELGLKVTYQEGQEDQVTVTLSDGLTPKYIEVADEAREDLKRAYGEAGKTCPDEVLNVIPKSLNDLPGVAITNPETLRNSGFTILEQSEHGHKATLTHTLEWVLKQQEESGEMFLQVFPDDHGGVRYVFELQTPEASAKQTEDINSMCAMLDQLREQSLPPKPSFEGELEWGDLSDVERRAFELLGITELPRAFSQALEGSDLLFWHARRVLLEAGFPEYRLVLELPGRVVTHTIDDQQGGDVAEGNRVTFTIDEAFLCQFGLGGHRFRVESVLNCSTYCEDKAEHVIWDRTSDWPDCECICETGWQRKESDGPLECVPCERICGEKKGGHWIYDQKNTEPNHCPCLCQDGYEPKYDDDVGDEVCKLVECPQYSKNVATLSASCPKDRLLNRHCCCQEGYIRYGSVCAELESGEEDYFIRPAVSEIRVGEKVEFSLVRKQLGRYTTVSNDEIDWRVTVEKSINPNISDVTIGKIDPKTGVFIGSNIGTCEVGAIVDRQTKAKAGVTVKCPGVEKGNLNGILRLYELRIPKGQLWHDLDSLSQSYHEYDPNDPAQLLDDILSNPPAAGYFNNLRSVFSDQYDSYVCQAYQDRVMKFLHDIQSNPEECALLNGLEFRRIAGWQGMHLAVVIYEASSSWDRTGTVLDPWPSQKPDAYSIDQWKFYGRTTDTSSTAVAALRALLGMVMCPADILITDSQGRRLGVLEDGSVVDEIPNSFIVDFQDDETENSWYFELDSEVSSTFNLQILGTTEGTFEFVWADSSNAGTRYYGPQSITAGATAQIVLDPDNPMASLVLPDGTEVQPTILEPAGLTVKVGEVSGAHRQVTEVPIEVTGAANVGSMYFELAYDATVLTATEVRKGTLTANSLLQPNLDEPGRLKVALIDANGFSGDGSVAVVVFDVPGKDGATSALTLENVRASDATSLDALVVQPTNGGFRVEVSPLPTPLPPVAQSPPRQPMPWLPFLLAVGGLLVAAVVVYYLYSRRSHN